MRITKLIKNGRYFVLIIIVGLIVLFPSFNIHFDGDSLLTLFRFQHIVGPNRQYNYFNYFFTDYGPQDLVFASIYHFFGLNPPPFYVISFILRIIAAFSFFPLVYYLFKNKTAAYLASLFFLATSTGLETTGWVFNMPSYIAIMFFNFFLLSVFKSKQQDSLKLIIISTILFGLTIIVQPIRMAFLPLLGISIEVTYLLLNIKKSNKKYSIARIFIYISLVLSIFLFGKIGGSIGIGGANDRLKGDFVKNILNYFSDFKPVNGRYEFKFFLYPIAQLGQMVFPNRLVLRSWETISFIKTLIFVITPAIAVFGFVLQLFKAGYSNLKNEYFRKFFWVGFIWTLGTGVYLTYFQKYPLQTSELLAFIAGGCMLILTTIVILSTLKNKTRLFYTIAAIFIIAFGYLIFWLRNPSVINTTQERYLIVPSVGITLLLSSFIANAKNKFPIYLFFSAAILIHAFASFKYLKHLSDIRGIQITNKIRNSIPDVFDKKGNTPIVFYFQPANSEILDKTLMFGFPVIVYYQYGIDYPWRLVYTWDWKEVVSAYTDGEATKKYTSKKEVVKLDDIYSFYLEGDTLIDTTNTTRKKLLNLNNEAR